MKRRNFFTTGIALGAGALAKPAGAFAENAKVIQANNF